MKQMTQTYQNSQYTNSISTQSANKSISAIIGIVLSSMILVASVALGFYSIVSSQSGAYMAELNIIGLYPALFGVAVSSFYITGSILHLKNYYLAAFIFLVMTSLHVLAALIILFLVVGQNLSSFVVWAILPVGILISILVETTICFGDYRRSKKNTVVTTDVQIDFANKVSKTNRFFSVSDKIFSISTAILSIFLIWFLAGVGVIAYQSSSAEISHVSILVAIGITILFISSSIISFKANSSLWMLFSAIIAIIAVLASVTWGLYLASELELGWDFLTLLFILVPIIYVIEPFVQISAVIVFCTSLYRIFSSNFDASITTKRFAILSITIGVLISLGLICAICMKNSENVAASEELQATLEQYEEKWLTERNEIFENSSYPSRNFVLEESFDINKDSILGGYEFFYRSKESGLNWRLYEFSDEFGYHCQAQLDTIFSEDNPLYGLDEFIIVEESNGNNYDYAYRTAHESNERETYVTLTDKKLSKELLDIYTSEKIQNIRQGKEQYVSPPRSTDNKQSSADKQGGQNKSAQKEIKHPLTDEQKNILIERGFSKFYDVTSYVNEKGQLQHRYVTPDHYYWKIQYDPATNSWLAQPQGIHSNILLLENVIQSEEEKLKLENSGYTIVNTDKISSEFLDNYQFS